MATEKVEQHEHRIEAFKFIKHQAKLKNAYRGGVIKAITEQLPWCNAYALANYYLTKWEKQNNTYLPKKNELKAGVKKHGIRLKPKCTETLFKPVLDVTTDTVQYNINEDGVITDYNGKIIYSNTNSSYIVDEELARMADDGCQFNDSTDRILDTIKTLKEIDL